MHIPPSIASLTESGTRLWLDSVDPKLTTLNRDMGVTGATSNPIIIADLLKSGRFDSDIASMAKDRLSAEEITWNMTDRLVTEAEQVFRPIFDRTHRDDGYVSFEVDPLLEDTACTLPISERSKRYIELAKKWSASHPNRMIKVPATPSGLGALEGITAAGIPINVTLIFSKRQYELARDAVWRGAGTLANLSSFKSVYSIFVSRVDLYTEARYPDLSPAAQGFAGIVNAQLLWRENQKFWQNHATPLAQEIVFASTGTKKASDVPWKYVAALAGSDIQTNPPATNDAVARSQVTFAKAIDQLPPKAVVDELLQKINWNLLEEDLMREGLAKFSDPHKALLKLVESKMSGGLN